MDVTAITSANTLRLPALVDMQSADESGSAPPPAAGPSTEQTATDAFGLGFEDLLRIVLTQLTYQDPLKPMDNFEFVSQLAQFSQIQQTQTMSERMLAMLQAEATTQATSLLGKIVDVPTGANVVTGRVTSISFRSGEPRLTIETSDNRTISDIALSGISRVAIGED